MWCKTNSKYTDFTETLFTGISTTGKPLQHITNQVTRMKLNCSGDLKKSKM